VSWSRFAIYPIIQSGLSLPARMSLTRAPSRSTRGCPMRSSSVSRKRRGAQPRPRRDLGRYQRPASPTPFPRSTIQRGLCPTRWANMKKAAFIATFIGNPPSIAFGDALRQHRHWHLPHRRRRQTLDEVRVWVGACLCDPDGNSSGDARSTVSRRCGKWSCHLGGLSDRARRSVQHVKFSRNATAETGGAKTQILRSDDAGKLEFSPKRSSAGTEHMTCGFAAHPDDANTLCVGYTTVQFTRATMRG